MNTIYDTEERRLLREQLRRFVTAEVVPVAERWEEAGMVPRAVLRAMGNLGFLGIRYPESFGGSGQDTMGSIILAEELGRSGFGGFAATVLVHTDMASPHIARFGTDEQLRRWMPSIIRGETITAICVTEPDAGSDVAGIRTTARRDGDHYVLNGAKMFITNGVHADLYCVAARTDPAAKGSRGITMFVVERGTPGFRVSRALKKLGWLCSDTAELSFEDCRVPVANRLGNENEGFYAIMRNFQNERLVLGALAVAASDRAIELTIDYVRTRKAFGAPLFDKQGIRQRLAMRRAEVEAARQLVYHVAWLDARGEDCVGEVSMVKALCGELSNRVTYDCLQFHGGFGYLRDSTIERMSRDARIDSIGGGATEVMLEEVAKRF
ncbi:MAG: acyl-CoA dehydrogenase family protein [Alphaproteobacteria bacterium]